MNSDFSLCGAFFCDNAQVVALFAIDGHCLTCGPKWGIDRKDKMLFLLTVLNVAYVLDSNLQPLEDPAPNATPEEIAKVAELKKKREEDKFTCCGHILNTLSDRLYDLYMSMQSPMEIWKALEEKYNTERFRDLKVIIPKSLQVEAIISKLPSSWNDYRKKLLHMIEDFTVEKILRHLRIEEETRKRDVVYLPQGSKVNHVSESKNSRKGKRKATSETEDTQDRKGKSRNCYHCNKKGHYIKDCKLLKREKDATTSKANMVEDMDLVAMATGGIKSLEIGMITEFNIAMTDKSYNWWLNFGTTVHVCNDRQQFKSYEPVANREVLMGNHQSVKGRWNSTLHPGRN
ncbi:uncharacterized protein LOC116212127 [Punica granatum]|uniref:Uncharacterized protein LOC116212127 n=1 Tax=Punica granatum TaxID=22663 RepID=A0A6P8EBA6_PUNGR|nr:uncharacterized protein LOC116212127 [Punica granatum]